MISECNIQQWSHNAMLQGYKDCWQRKSQEHMIRIAREEGNLLLRGTVVKICNKLFGGHVNVLPM